MVKSTWVEIGPDDLIFREGPSMWFLAAPPIDSRSPSAPKLASDLPLTPQLGLAGK